MYKLAFPILVIAVIVSLIGYRFSTTPKASEQQTPDCINISVQGQTSSGTAVSSGERKRLQVFTANTSASSLRYSWSVNSTNSESKGSFSSTSTNPVLWTAPTNPTADQTWELKVIIKTPSNRETTCSKTLTFVPEQTNLGQNLFKNSSFEDGIIESTNSDRDPISWVIKEGKFRILDNGGESGDVIEEFPRMTQVTMQTNGVKPHSGNNMLDNSTRKGLKSQFRQNYSSPITDGTYVQRLSLYIPSQNGFVQQMEYRRGLELLHFRWTDQWTNYCWVWKDGSPRFCKKGFALSYDKWHDYVITLTKMPGSASNLWQVNVKLDGRFVIGSDGKTIPHLLQNQGQFGQIMIGDECMANSGSNLCDGYGTIYYDDIEAYNPK